MTAVHTLLLQSLMMMMMLLLLLLLPSAIDGQDSEPAETTRRARIARMNTGLERVNLRSHSRTHLPTHSFVFASALAGFPGAPAGEPSLPLGMPIPPADKFPLFAQAPGRQWVELSAGDGLFIPSETWHWVLSGRNSYKPALGGESEETMAISYWSETAQPGRERLNTLGQATRIPGAGSHWPAAQWTPEFLAEHIDELVDLDTEPPAAFCARVDKCQLRPEDFMARPDWMDVFVTFSDFVRAFRQTDKYACCMAMFVLNGKSPLVRSGAPDIPWTLDIDGGHEEGVARLWLARGPVSSGLHYDEPQNSLTLLRGSKHVLLFPAEATPFLYPALPNDPSEDLSTKEGRERRRERRNQLMSQAYDRVDEDNNDLRRSYEEQRAREREEHEERAWQEGHMREERGNGDEEEEGEEGEEGEEELGADGKWRSTGRREGGRARQQRRDRRKRQYSWDKEKQNERRDSSDL